ncbi:hypothetical protein SprV_0100225100 [Sparganum proliferum]
MGTQRYLPGNVVCYNTGTEVTKSPGFPPTAFLFVLLRLRYAYLFVFRLCLFGCCSALGQCLPCLFRYLRVLVVIPVLSFRNQQRHFPYFLSLCHVERRLRKVFHGSSRLGIDLFLQKFCERQMLTGHFVKLLMVVMTIIARVLIMSEQSIAITANTYNSLYAMRERIPVPTSLASYLDCLPTQIAADDLIKLNPNCTAFMNLRDNSVNGCSSTTVTDSPLPHLQAPASSKISVKQAGFSPATPLKTHFSPMTQPKASKTPDNADARHTKSWSARQDRAELLGILRRTKNKSRNTPDLLDMLLR